MPVNKTYVSCIYKWNKSKCKQWEGKAEIGGSGYSLKKTLPPEIDLIKPKINLGFTTRGCIRKCPFCIVPKKEGHIRAVGSIYDIWDGKSKEITLLDNNILALPEHFKRICSQLRAENLKVDFNQGLDCRLLTDEICQELFTLKHSREIRFAFDDIAYKPLVLKALEILKRNGLQDWQTRWYVYAGEKDTFDTVYERMVILRNVRQLVYLMRDKKVYDDVKFMALASWAGEPGTFKMTDFPTALTTKRLKQYRKFFTDELETIENGLFSIRSGWGR